MYNQEILETNKLTDEIHELVDEHEKKFNVKILFTSCDNLDQKFQLIAIKPLKNINPDSLDYQK